MHRSFLRLLHSRSPQQPIWSRQSLPHVRWLVWVLPLLALAPNVTAQEAFITVWSTNGPDQTITIPTNGEGVSTYDFTIDWGDGVSEHYRGEDPDPEHTYSEAGHYAVAITGTFPRIVMAEISPIGYSLISVEQWGSIAWESMEGGFAGLKGLVINAQDTPDLSQVNDMQRMFFGGTWFNSDLSDWDVSNVTNMSEMFSWAQSFNQPLGSWDVSNVTDMSGMFYQAYFNQPLEGWDVSNVTDMSGMFAGAGTFNQPLEGWDVSNVTNMSGMFARAGTFNQPLEGWDVSNVTNMSGMFSWAQSFNQPLGSWDVSNVTDMFRMFSDAEVFNQPLASWDVSDVTNMSGMFYEASSFNQPLGSWDVSNVTDMSSMFRWARQFNQPLGSWDVSNVTDMSGMFLIAPSFDQPLGSWDVSRVTNMGSMFVGASSFNQPLGSWDVSKVTDMSGMFSSAHRFNQQLAQWDVSHVNNMSYMFLGAVSFDQSLGTWDVSRVASLDGFLRNGQLSSATYDSLLVGWSQIELQSGLRVEMGTSTYTEVGQAARTHIINEYGWYFIDGGLHVPPDVEEDDPSDVEENPDEVEDDLPPDTFALHAPFPNPAQAHVIVRYDVPEETDVYLVLYNSLGQAVLTLNEGLAGPGVHERSLRLDGLAGGVYVLRLSAGAHVESRLLTVVP